MVPGGGYALNMEPETSDIFTITGETFLSEAPVTVSSQPYAGWPMQASKLFTAANMVGGSAGDGDGDAPAFASKLDNVLKVGRVVHLFPGKGQGEGRATTRVLGWNEGRFIMLSLPGAGSSPMMLHEGHDLVMRCVIEGEVYSVMCKVQMVQYQPTPLLFVSYPVELEVTPLRSRTRIPVCLPVMVSWAPAEGDQPRGFEFGFLRDLNPDGALLEVPLPEGINVVGRHLQVTFSVGMGEEVWAFGQVRHQARGHRTERLGLALDWENEQARDRVIAYLHIP